MTGISRIRRLRHRSLNGLSRDRLSRTEDDLAVGINASLAGISKLSLTIIPTINVNSGTNIITISGEDDLAANGPRRIFLNGANLPAPLEEGTIYYWQDDGTDTYKIYPDLPSAIEASGGEVDLFTTGGGEMIITFLDP